MKTPLCRLTQHRIYFSFTQFTSHQKIKSDDISNYRVMTNQLNIIKLSGNSDQFHLLIVWIHQKLIVNIIKFNHIWIWMKFKRRKILEKNKAWLLSIANGNPTLKWNERKLKNIQVLFLFRKKFQCFFVHSKVL